MELVFLPSEQKYYVNIRVSLLTRLENTDIEMVLEILGILVGSLILQVELPLTLSPALGALFLSLIHH